MNYEYDNKTHNTTDPSIIVPKLYDLFSPTTVIDIGCGLGNFLFEFKNIASCKVLGVDGDTHSDDKRLNFLSTNEFIRADLTKPLNINQKFDLALCLEVAEHLPSSSAEHLINELITVSDTIVFPAAVPLQGGQFHINEQWQSYWSNKFEKFNFYPVDCVRPLIWNNPKVSFWYKQNLLVFMSKEAKMKSTKLNEETILVDVVHPQNYLGQASYLEQLLQGKGKFIFYVYLLIKYFQVKLFKK